MLVDDGVACWELSVRVSGARCVHQNLPAAPCTATAVPAMAAAAMLERLRCMVAVLAMYAWACRREREVRVDGEEEKRLWAVFVWGKIWLTCLRRF